MRVKNIKRINLNNFKLILTDRELNGLDQKMDQNCELNPNFIDFELNGPKMSYKLNKLNYKFKTKILK